MSALRKILVVDDDPVVGTSFNRVLSDKGYVVTTAANANEALAKLRAINVRLSRATLSVEGSWR